VAQGDGTSGPYRESHLLQLREWFPYDCDDRPVELLRKSLQDTLGQRLWMSVLRLPGADTYLRALDDAVQSAIRGQSTPQAALEPAAGRWQELLTAAGSDQQATAYLKQLGIKP
jgi:hypothetical protein